MSCKTLFHPLLFFFHLTPHGWRKGHTDSHGPLHPTQILLLIWKMAHCYPPGTNKRNVWTACLHCETTVYSPFALTPPLLLHLFFSMFSISIHVLPPRPGHRTNSEHRRLSRVLFNTNAVRRVCYGGSAMAAHAGGKSLVGPSWMDELSGSQSCEDDDLDVMKSQIPRCSFLPAHSQRETPLSEITPRWPWK